jgi:hypothetical protein
MNDINKDLEQLIELGKNQYPVIEQDIKAFNAVNTENQEYIDYLNLINTAPLPIVNNQTED